MSSVGHRDPSAAAAGGSRAMVAPAVLLVGFLVLAAAFSWAGVRLGGDSPRYLDGAARLLEGAPLAGKQANYLSYLGLVALAHGMGAGLAGVVGVQILGGAVAVLAAWDLGRRLGGPVAGWLAGAAVGWNPLIVNWHRFILTDSLYISCLTLSVWALSRVRLRPAWVIMLLALLTFTALLRPNGWLLGLLVPLWLLGRAGWSGRRIAAAGLVLFVTGAVVLAALRPLRAAVDAERPATMLSRGVVVWGYPDWDLDMPGEVISAAEPWTRGVGYAVSHPIAVARLAAARIGVSLAHVRPYWSTRHNVAVAALLIPLYLLAMAGWTRVRNDDSARLIAAVTVAHLLLVGVTFADWDGRSLLHVLPLIAVLAAVGASGLVVRRRLRGSQVAPAAPSL